MLTCIQVKRRKRFLAKATSGAHHEDFYAVAMDAAALPVDQTRPTSTEHGNVPLPSPKSRPITYGEFLERRVRIRNLKLKSDLNGLFGSIKGFDPQTVRCLRV